MRPMPDSEHPGLDTWIEYCDDHLPAAREDELQEHMVDCPECVALVRDLAAFERAEKRAPSDGSADDPAAAAEIDTILRTTRAEPEPIRSRPRRRGGIASWLLPLAATLLVAVALASLLWGLGLQAANQALEERVASLSGPQADAAVEDLYSDLVTRNGDAADTTVTLAPETPFVTWVIHLPPGIDLDRFRAELAEAGGRRLWEGGGLTRDERYHTVRLGMPGELLDEGRFVLRLFPGGERAEAEPIAVYDFRVRREGQRPVE